MGIRPSTACGLSHLFYMDDLKTFAKDYDHQQGLLTMVKTFVSDIKIECGLLEKCAKATFKRGRLTTYRQLCQHQRTGARKNLQISGGERRRRHSACSNEGEDKKGVLQTN